MNVMNYFMGLSRHFRLSLERHTPVESACSLGSTCATSRQHLEPSAKSITSYSIQIRPRRAHEKLFASPSLFLGLSQASDPFCSVRRSRRRAIEPQPCC